MEEAGRRRQATIAIFSIFIEYIFFLLILIKKIFFKYKGNSPARFRAK